MPSTEFFQGVCLNGTHPTSQQSQSLSVSLPVQSELSVGAGDIAPKY